jgi:hypothetical protein
MIDQEPANANLASASPCASCRRWRIAAAVLVALALAWWAVEALLRP